MALRRGRTGLQGRCGSDRASNELATAVGTDAAKTIVRAGRTEGALERTDARFRLGRQIRVAAFAIGFQSQHRSHTSARLGAKKEEHYEGTKDTKKKEGRRSRRWSIAPDD
jgi:hypothetical protein